MNKIYTDSEFEKLLECAVVQNFEDMLGTIPPKEELAEMYPVSERHKTRMEKMLRKVHHMDFWESAIQWSRRIAAIAVILTAVFFGALLALSPSVRAAVSDTIIKWFDGFTKFLSGESDGTGIESSNWRPSYLPEGFLESDILNMRFNTQITYADANGVQIRFSVTPADGSVAVNNEGVNYSQFKEENIIYHVFESFDEEKYNSIEWVTGGYTFSLFSSISIESLKLIALSVTP